MGAFERLYNLQLQQPKKEKQKNALFGAFHGCWNQNISTAVAKVRPENIYPGIH